MFIMVNNWNAFRIEEKRSFQLAQLPLPAITAGMARFVLIALLSGSFLAVYGVVRAIALPETGVVANIYLLIPAKRASETGIARPAFIRAME